MKKRIIVGVSSCLTGEKVRFDGGHKRDHYLCDFLAKYVDFLPICPEVAIGMGIPRPIIHLQGDPANPRLIEVKHPERDYTSAMLDFAKICMTELKNISGYILKSKSPTCGWKLVKIYQDTGQVSYNGQGLYAKILQTNYPCLPIEEEGRLNDPRLRENFVERLFIYKEWQDLVESGLTLAKILAFHTRHKLILMAHHPINSHKLGETLSCLDRHSDIKQFAANYIDNFMQTLRYIATPKKHANVLQHCLGYFKKALTKIDKHELLVSITHYREGLLPLIVPITLLKHHMNHHSQPYLDKQSYLSPYPEELMLRNHI